MIHQQAITGEQTAAEKGTPQCALENFYQAFNNRDLQKMTENWLQTEEEYLILVRSLHMVQILWLFSPGIKKQKRLIPCWQ